MFGRKSSRSLDHADRAWNLARYQGQLEHGPIKVGYSPYIDSRCLLPLFRLSADSGVRSQIILESVSTGEETSRVLQGHLDAALGIHPIDDEDLWVKAVSVEGFSLCVQASHPLARKSEVTVKDLHDERILWMPRSRHPGFYGSVTGYLQSLGVEPIFKEVEGHAHALELAAEGVGLALMPRSAARVTRTGVVFKSVADRYLLIQTMLFMRRDQRYGRAKDFVDDLLSRLAKLFAEPIRQSH
jgi:LysR family transcriptional regulator, benzoate and cis,cis-muconate-responsive activator of ben and cat genes